MRGTHLIGLMVTTVFPVTTAARPAPPATRDPAMMAVEHRPHFAALRRRLLACDDAIGWACLGAAGGLLLYMAALMLIAWIVGRI